MDWPQENKASVFMDGQVFLKVRIKKIMAVIFDLMVRLVEEFMQKPPVPVEHLCMEMQVAQVVVVLPDGQKALMGKVSMPMPMVSMHRLFTHMGYLHFAPGTFTVM